jgi:hypothetical protein
MFMVCKYKSQVWCLLVISILVTLPKNVNAMTGGQDGGGGDSYVQDFIHVAEFEVLPWIEKKGNQLYPSVSAQAFRMAVSDLIVGRTIWSEDIVFETCDGSQRGRVVDACYNYTKNELMISRTRYPLAINNSAIKRKLVAHEIFRKMKLEGDDYALSNQMKFDDIIPNTQKGPLNARCLLSYENAKGETENHFISTQGETEGVLTSTPLARQVEISIKSDFIAQLISYSADSNQLARIYIVGFGAPFQTHAAIEPGKSSSVALDRGMNKDLKSLNANCELFQ